MKTLKAKINWLFLLLMGCSVLITGVFVALLLKDSYVDSLKTRLSKEAEMIGKTIDWDELINRPTQMQNKAEIYEQTLDVSVTFLDQNGKVLSDSRNERLRSTSQKHHIEVQKALASKRLISFTKRKGNLIHAAIPVIKENTVIGVIRLSLDLKDINQSLWRVWLSLIGGLMIAYALAAFASSRIASRVTQPLEAMTQVAVDITKKRFHRRVHGDGDDEVANLGDAINRMAYHLQKQMSTIRQSERKLISVMESLESGLIMVDSSGMVAFANQAFEQIYGISPEKVTNMSYRGLIYPFDLHSLIHQCMKKEQKMSKEIQLHYPTEKIYEIHLSPILEKIGISVVVVLYDMTAVRRLEQMRQDFVANVSHELKTPITSIRGFSETLLDGEMEDPDTSREFLQIIHEESIRLQRLIADLLDLSRIESKKMKLSLEKVSIETLVQSVVKTMEDQLKSKKQTLRLSIEPFPVQVEVDSFRQILLNLLSNAISYTIEGGKIQIKAERVVDQWHLIVKDTGIGIPLEDQSRVFERFYRVDKDRSRDSGGTGLGLAIVKHLVELHQGSIDLESSLSKGTEFRLTFPVQMDTEN